jgi:hypothetical protein
MNERFSVIPDIMALAQLIEDVKPIVTGVYLDDSLDGIDVYIKNVRVTTSYSHKTEADQQLTPV